MRKLLALSLILFGISSFLKTNPSTQVYGEVAQGFFVPGLALIFLVSYFLSLWFLKVIDQPPLMIYILSMVVKMMASLTLLLVYLLKHFGPQNEGALVFLILYLIFEFLEIRRFLSILRPDSRENHSE
jgi:hypothetical protein